jgi:L-threonylcarbamoyladenylate synthase
MTAYLQWFGKRIEGVAVNKEKETLYLRVDPENPEPEKIEVAAAVIRAGGLVAFPTETVYGLGANAFDRKAVEKIFAVKGRPRRNPLIVHVASVEQARQLVASWPKVAEVLAGSFWPGPLTLVLPRAPQVPDEVTAGLPNVGLRFPAHKVALALITTSGVPLAAPSANLSGRPSPTRAEHVKDDLEGRIDLILDGGPTGVGVESTVLDLTGKSPLILRPGGVTREELEEVLGEKVDISEASEFQHYTPRAAVVMVVGEPGEQVAKIKKYLETHPNLRVGILVTAENADFYGELRKLVAFFKVLGSRKRPEEVAAELFGALREGDKKGLDVLLVETVPASGIGLAVLNRVTQAAGNKVI